jgi:hypothetical protein
LFLLLLRYRFRQKFRHGIFSFIKTFSKASQRASSTVAIKPNVRGAKQLDHGIADTFVSSAPGEVSFRSIDFQDWFDAASLASDTQQLMAISGNAWLV